LDLNGKRMPSGVGVSKVMVFLVPGAIGAIVESFGKHTFVGHPAGAVVVVHPTWKPWGFVPLFVSVSVTGESFCVDTTVFENPVSSTVRSTVATTSVTPSLSG
jgi:hypothetical protein